MWLCCYGAEGWCVRANCQASSRACWPGRARWMALRARTSRPSWQGECEHEWAQTCSCQQAGHFDPVKVALLAPANTVHTVRWANGLAQRGLDVHLLTAHDAPPPLQD